ncbi:MAG: hypothetical protein FJX03_06870 [Alphaproteobacteria bacterium]|nr:hypothetical protein [Alphaproteobacteria bacterium]
MNTRLFIWLTTVFGTSSILGAQPTGPSNIYDKDARNQILQAQKQNTDVATQQRIDTRAKGREIQAKADVVVNVTNEIQDLIRKAPLSIQQQNATTVVAVLNQVVQGAGVLFRAYGRRKEALQTIMGTNEQILEAAIKSYEKIQAQSVILEKLIGPTTIQSAMKKAQNLTGNKSQIISGLLNPANYLNTFVAFTDSLLITDNKADRWEKIKLASKSLSEEQSRFDDYIALLELKVLENMMMEYHRIENFNTVKNPNKNQENPQGYINILKTSFATLGEAIRITDQKILALKADPPKGNVLNKFKKVVGKDSQTLNNQTLSALTAEREKYVKQKQDLEDKIAYYQDQSTTLDPKKIAEGKANTLAQIKSIQMARVSKANLNDLVQQVVQLTNQVTQLQNDLKTLKKTP